MKLHALGIDYRHGSDFSIERPAGSGDNLLVIFKTPAQVRMGDVYDDVPADTFVLYSKDKPQFYRATEEEFINHWIHFDIENGEGFLNRICLPFDTILKINDPSSVENILLQLNLEALGESPNKSECINLLLRLLMAKLGGSHINPEQLSVHHSVLRSLRAEIYRNPAQNYTVADFAARVSLSPSHFQSLYKSEFGVSFYEDVITSRMDMAKYYLSGTMLSINRISELCGYENDVHFMRQFKSRIGMTAGEYRKSMK